MLLPSGIQNGESTILCIYKIRMLKSVPFLHANKKAAKRETNKTILGHLAGSIHTACDT